MADLDGDAAPVSLQLLAEEVILNLPAVELVLDDAVHVAAAGAGLSCGITYVTGYGVVTVASSDERAAQVDEVQYEGGQGPCLEALRTRTVVRVEDQQSDPRWGGYRELALRAGVRASLSLPLVVGDTAVGALNVYTTQAGPLSPDQEAAALVAASQVTGVLQAVRSLAEGLLRDSAAARGFQARHDVDVATGILMARHKCGHDAARAMLVERAGARGVPVQDIVADVIASGGSETSSPP